MRPVIFPDSHLTLPPALCPSIGHYVGAWAYGSSGMDWTLPFDKRDKSTHRFDIADTRGRMSLTVPVAKPATSRVRWDEIAISTHGEWWDVHRVALESAYGRTPYFEFYIDPLLPMLTAGVESRFPLLHQLASAWDSAIRSMLGMEQAAHSSPSLSGSQASPAVPVAKLPSYRQIRADRLGFIPGLSVLDLIFNLGPESQLYLHSAAEATLSPDVINKTNHCLCE